MRESIINSPESNYKQNIDHYDHFIAIDWSQENVVLARSTSKKEVIKLVEWEKSEIKLIKEYLSHLKGKKILTIEETNTSQWLYTELKELVERIIICDPYRNRLLSEGPKTDKIDARKLCQLLRSGLLKEVFHSCDRLYDLRQLLSAYDDLVKAGVRIQNQRSALYRSKGYRYTKKEHLQLKKDALSNKGFDTFISDWHERTIEQYNADKRLFEEKIEKMVKSTKAMKVLTQLPGIGYIFAFKIYAVVIQARRFRTKGSYLSYCGLVLLEKSSGQRSYGKRLPRYNRQLKAVYKTAVRTAIQGGNNPLYEYYQFLIEKGLTHKQATLTAARYLAKVSLGMMKTGQAYEPYRWRKDEIAA